jgi:hypothetical protein
MGEILTPIFESWTEGCNTSIQPDDLPPNAFPRGRNVALKNLGTGKAVVACRPGFLMFTPSTLVTSTYAINARGLFELNTWVAGTGSTAAHYTPSLIAPVAYSTTGAIVRYTWTGDSSSCVTITSGASILGTETHWGFENVQGLGILGNGLATFMTDGTTIATAGVTRPTLGTATTITSTSTGLHNGTYAGRVTFGISSIGFESSASDDTSTTVTVTNASIAWAGLPLSSNPFVDRRYLYVRNTASQANYYRVGTITDNTSTTATTSALDANNTTIAPSTTVADPPLATCHIFAWFRNRLFASDGRLLYWSGLNKGFGFDSLSSGTFIGTDDQKITSLVIHNDTLLIMKERAVYALVGDAPSSWVIRVAIPDIGSKGKAFAQAEGSLYWQSERGPMRWTGDGEPVQIGLPFISGTLTTDYGAINDTVALIGHDEQNQRILFTFTTLLGEGLGQTTLPYNYRLNRWESDGWDPCIITAWGFTTTPKLSGHRTTLCADNYGKVYQMSQASVGYDGCSLTALGMTTRDGTVSVAGGASTVTCTGAFSTSYLLLGHSVSFTDTAGEMVARRYIIAANANTITLNAVVTADGTYTQTCAYHIAQTAIEWDSPWTDLGHTFEKKRFEYCYLLFDATTIAIPLLVEMTLDGDDTGTHQTQVSTDPKPTNSLIHVTPRRVRIGRTGRIWRARITATQAAGEFLLMSVGLRAELLSDKLG